MPQKHFGLLQEQFIPDAWKIGVTCIFLNCTTRTQVENVVYDFFDKWNCCTDLLSANDEEIKSVIKSLGFQNMRHQRLIQFSFDYAVTGWKGIKLRGLGAYGIRCLEMLIDNNMGLIPPKDHALLNFWRWKRDGTAQSSRIFEFDGRECPCKECK